MPHVGMSHSFPKLLFGSERFEGKAKFARHVPVIGARRQRDIMAPGLQRKSQSQHGENIARAAERGAQEPHGVVYPTSNGSGKSES